MLGIELIRERTEEVKESVRRRKANVDVDHILSLDKERRELVGKVDELRAKKNKLSDVKGKPDQSVLDEARKVKEELKSVEPKLESIEKELHGLMMLVPNLLHSSVPDGKDDTENQVLREWGKIPEFNFNPKEHYEIGEHLGIIDTTRSAKISGSRFSYLFGDLVKMQFAVIHLVMELLTDPKKVGKIAQSVGNRFDTPFIPVLPPVIAKSEIMKKMDRFDPIDDRYYLEKDDALLIGSAEHTLGPLHMDETFVEKDLPIRYLGYSTAFRREAGTYGKDMKGILRRHQFDKLEMESFASPEDGEKEQDLMVAIQEHIMRTLGIPHQVVVMCTGDIGKPDYRQIDINAWLPGQDKYRETHTSDYMTDFQARRLNTRVRNKSNELEFVHMNDATASAGRTLIAILENYQQEDGSVVVPKALRKHMGTKKIG